MAARLQVDGLAELRAALRALPRDLVREAQVIVQAHAEAAARRIAAAYPTGPTGNLRRGVSVEPYRDASTATARVRSRAHHAHLFERGTVARRWKGQNRGVMPAAPVFIPAVVQQRRIMVSALIDLVERAGLHVTGLAA